MNERCETCRFWLGTAGNGAGYCRRFPPPMARSEFDDFPTTWKDQWCGEWQPDPEMQPQPEVTR